MKKTMGFTWLIVSMVLIAFTACRDDDDPQPTQQLSLNITGLPNLGPGFAYEGWIIVNSAPVSTGTFTVDEFGVFSQSTFNINRSQLNSATAFVLTIEPSPDSDPAPTDIHILAGNFTANNAVLVSSHPLALNNDFTSASGSYILATPTDGMNNNENSGLWFLIPGALPGPSLNLPTLPSGWKYEGWAVINDLPVTTGKFTSIGGADESAPYSGTLPPPLFPGEDFLVNAPAGLSFPTNLQGQKVVITIEPDPDNSPAPFSLKPLSADVDTNAIDHTSYNMMNTTAASFPSGSATR